MQHMGYREQPPRTVLEDKIRQRRQTFEEFSAYAEDFARRYGDTATLSPRHVQRLASGQRSDGRPLGPVRPATRRLLEQIFGVSIEQLVAAPTTIDDVEPEQSTDSHDVGELKEYLGAARRLDATVINLMTQQLNDTRRLDRQLGAIVVHDEVRAKIDQTQRLLSYSVIPGVREQLAAFLAELCTLAGWQTLDRGKINESWHYYEKAKSAASQSGSIAFEAHTAAEQAFVLLDAGEPAAAVELLTFAQEKAAQRIPQLLQSWLSAACGEAYAASGLRDKSLRAFDRAAELLPFEVAMHEGPYVVLDPTHLARWRGHALARFGDPAAVTVLTDALDNLDRTFTRAEAGLRVDLASAFTAIGEHEAAGEHLTHARLLAAEVGSIRQCRRLAKLAALAGSV